MKDAFSKPTKLNDLDVAFGGGGNIRTLMPPMDQIPEEFRRDRSPWTKWQAKWFFSGLSPSDQPKIKDGINENDAWRHLKTIQGSFAPKHEHKMAAVGYLASLWFEPLAEWSATSI